MLTWPTIPEKPMRDARRCPEAGVGSFSILIYSPASLANFMAATNPEKPDLTRHACRRGSAAFHLKVGRRAGNAYEPAVGWRFISTATTPMCVWAKS